MTKKEVKTALKNNGVKGFSNAAICLETRWVVVGEYCGKIDETNILHLRPLDQTDTTSRHYVIQL